jgi:hypothetical protein
MLDIIVPLGFGQNNPHLKGRKGSTESPHAYSICNVKPNKIFPSLATLMFLHTVENRLIVTPWSFDFADVFTHGRFAIESMIKTSGRGKDVS